MHLEWEHVSYHCIYKGSRASQETAHLISSEKGSSTRTPASRASPSSVVCQSNLTTSANPEQSDSKIPYGDSPALFIFKVDQCTVIR